MKGAVLQETATTRSGVKKKGLNINFRKMTWEYLVNVLGMPGWVRMGSAGLGLNSDVVVEWNGRLLGCQLAAARTLA